MTKLASALLALAAAAAFTAPATAQVPGTRLPSGATVPNFTGIWERPDGQGILFDPARSIPSYTPAYEARYKAAVAARERGDIVVDPTSRCLPPGVPRLMVATYPLEILQTPGQVTIIAEWSSQVRRIFTDGRGHPPADELDPTFNGHSIGRWEGDTLVVETVGLRGDNTFDASPLIHSDKMTVHERIRLRDPNTLEAVITVKDPEAFTKDWTVTRVYTRGPPGLQIMEYVCNENNRDYTGAERR